MGNEQKSSRFFRENITNPNPRSLAGRCKTPPMMLCFAALLHVVVATTNASNDLHLRSHHRRRLGRAKDCANLREILDKEFSEKPEFPGVKANSQHEKFLLQQCLIQALENEIGMSPANLLRFLGSRPTPERKWNDVKASGVQ